MVEEISVQIECPAVMELLRPVDLFVRNLLDQVPAFKENDELIDSLALVFDEAFTNISKHAYTSEGKGPVWIRIAIASDHLEYRFEDLGESFDPLEIQDPDLSHPHEGGYGVWLIRQIMDEFHYSSKPKCKNVLRLIKYFPQVAGARTAD